MINLIRDRWIPLRTRNAVDAIRPCDIVRVGEAELCGARPDYNGALIQILIGLYQTFVTPRTEDEWADWLHDPPTSEELAERLEPWAHAFELSGEFAFMQDAEDFDGSSKQIDALHLTAPGEQTLNHNKDFFQKRQDSYRICAVCAALGVAAAQFNAPAGGPGFRTSVRGGGPITTVFRGRSLWQDVWLNIIPQSSSQLTPVRAEQVAQALPWMGPCRESSKTGVATTTEDVNGHQVYWSCSKRLRLDPFEQLDAPVACDCCGASTHAVVASFREIQYGTNYTGPWLHPLTPYTYSDKGDAPNPLKGAPGGLRYNHWRGIVAERPEKNQKPAEVIQRLRTHFEAEDRNEAEPRVWAFGYDADNAKIRSWHESTYPLHPLKDEERERFDLEVERLLNAAEVAASELLTAIKRALYGELRTGGNWYLPDIAKKNDKSLFIQAQTQFWHRTQAEFYAAMHDVREMLGDEEMKSDLKVKWLKTLRNCALAIFDEATSYGNFRNADPESSTRARRLLNWMFLHNVEREGSVAKQLEITVFEKEVAHVE